MREVEDYATPPPAFPHDLALFQSSCIDAKSNLDSGFSQLVEIVSSIGILLVANLDQPFISASSSISVLTARDRLRAGLTSSESYDVAQMR